MILTAYTSHFPSPAPAQAQGCHTQGLLATRGQRVYSPGTPQGHRCRSRLPSPALLPPESTTTRHSSRRGHSAQTLDGSAATPAGMPLTNPLAGSLPPFVNGIPKQPRPIVTTGIRLFTGHAFTGEYTARFLPRSFDCQCVEPLQKARHVIAACPLLAEPRRQFLATSQACMRSRRREPILDGEDHG